MGFIKNLMSLPRRMAESVASSSSTQLERLQKKRQAYLEVRDSDSPAEERKLEQIRRGIEAVSLQVFQSYIPIIQNIYEPLPFDAEEANGGESRIVSFDITKWVTDTKEDNIEKLTSLYQVLSGEECNIALIFRRDVRRCTVHLAIANTSDNYEPSISIKFAERMQRAIRGIFPGSTFSKREDLRAEKVFDLQMNGASVCAASVSMLASEKSERHIVQGIEKLLDGIVPVDEEDDYCLVLLASPVNDTETYRRTLYDQYTSLSPYAVVQKQSTTTDSASVMNIVTLGGGAHAGFSSGFSNSSGTMESTGTSESTGKSDSKSTGGEVHGGVLVAGGSVNHQEGSSTSKTVGKLVNAGSTILNGLTGGFNAGFNVNLSKSTGMTEGVSVSHGDTLTYTNYSVKHTLELIEIQMKRLENSKASGMWRFAAYAFSKSNPTVQSVAHLYASLSQGKDSYPVQSAINVWTPDDHDDGTGNVAGSVLNAVQHLRHPLFLLRPDIDKRILVCPELVDPSVLVSGSELAQSMKFPEKSVAGFPVIQCASFGRNAISKNLRSIKSDDGSHLNLGNIYHMQHEETIPVRLDVQSLAMHTFVTGSTGSGKSTAIYGILDDLMRKQIRFMVIEPAKGEYRQVFGSKGDVTVYGTNRRIDGMKLLMINPFSFDSENIHIYEHMDRLTEIFNVCWPMYAAMPAVLKEAIERAYEASGWDLESSENRYSPDLFPTFEDVLRQIRAVVDSSQYSADTKGDYSGALMTRLRSLTTGINRLLFTSDAILDEDLFDKNVIIDLSRIGSLETKSLIMGLLVLKLQEYRMAQHQTCGANENLKHVTVLEEAHNLLKRTSFEQSSESSNMIGKSVEMLTNAIAEMRTYGEGFIIADQSPGLLDMAAIRNTNTKIIMRLPEYSDRQLAGRSAGLTDDQIEELPRLPLGVAAVYQNDWIEAVLCKIRHYRPSHVSRKRWVDDDDDKKSVMSPITREEIISLLLSTEFPADDFEDRVVKTALTSEVKCRILDYLNSTPEESLRRKADIAFAYFNPEELFVRSEQFVNPEDWKAYARSVIKPNLPDLSEDALTYILTLLVHAEIRCRPESNVERFIIPEVQGVR